MRIGQLELIYITLILAVLFIPDNATKTEDGPMIDPSSYLTDQAQGPDYTVQDVWANHKHLSNYDNLKQAGGDTFPYLPIKFLEQYKNPCWKQHDDGPLRCLPYFQILGVSKCGTTDLYHRLTFNPNFVDCGWKGPHFWDESPYPSRKPGAAKFNGTFQAYVTIFHKASKYIEAHPEAITGEASSNTYTGVITYCRGVTWPRRLNVTLAQFLFEASPWSRFIVLFRDPVDRYYSAYYYYRTKSLGKGTPEEFHEKATADIKQWSDCLEANGNKEQACLQQYVPQQLIKGIYAGFLPSWLEVWPRNRFLFLRTEDYKAAPKHHVAAAESFLGIRNTSLDNLEEAVQMKAANVKRYSLMLPKTRILLQDFYRPYNQRLSKLLGDSPRWLWGY